MTSWKPSSNIFREPDSLVDVVRSVLIGETNKNDKSDDGEGLDAVQPKAVKKKFKDRKDKDIDNDGDTDSSDEYLHKRRKAVSKAMKESDVDEAKSSFRPAVAIKTLKKEFEPMRGKKISMDNAKKLTTIMNKFANDKDMLIQLMKADIPFVSQGAVTRLISKHGMKGAELNKMMKEDVDLEEGFINLGGAKVKDDEKSILQHIKKTFPNVKKVKKDPQHGWIPVFEDVDLDEGKIEDVLAVAKDNAANKHSPKGRDWGKLTATAAQKLIDKEMEKLGYAMTAGGKWIKEEVNPANKQHLCAKNVVHEQWGEGACLSEMHDDPDENGDIAWYDVMFEHGIEKQVSIEELKVTKSEGHIHSSHNKKKKVKEEDEVPCAECGKVHDGACAPEDMKEDIVVEAKSVKEDDEDESDKTDAQKNDMDGDGEKDSKKKKKKKKSEDEDEESSKPDKIDTEPQIKTMVSEREMTDKEKSKLEHLKKNFEGGEMHKSMKNKYGDKGDDVFYGKLTKMAMGEEVSLNIDEKKDPDGGDENFMMALRKAVSLRGQYDVAFKDGSKVKVSQKDAQNLLNRLQKEKPASREALMKSAYKSEKHFKMALKGKVDPKKNALDLD
jgi:hypothetical protein